MFEFATVKVATPLIRTSGAEHSFDSTVQKHRRDLAAYGGYTSASAKFPISWQPPQLPFTRGRATGVRDAPRARRCAYSFAASRPGSNFYELGRGVGIVPERHCCSYGAAAGFLREP